MTSSLTGEGAGPAAGVRGATPPDRTLATPSEVQAAAERLLARAEVLEGQTQRLWGGVIHQRLYPRRTPCCVTPAEIRAEAAALCARLGVTL